MKDRMVDTTSARGTCQALKIKAQQFTVFQAPEEGQKLGTPKIQENSLMDNTTLINIFSSV